MTIQFPTSQAASTEAGDRLDNDIFIYLRDVQNFMLYMHAWPQSTTYTSIDVQVLLLRDLNFNYLRHSCILNMKFKTSIRID